MPPKELSCEVYRNLHILATPTVTPPIFLSSQTTTIMLSNTPSAPSIQLYDTTLRDGTQGEGVNFSSGDKLRIARKLDELGIHYIEGGWPGSNPKVARLQSQGHGFLRAGAE